MPGKVHFELPIEKQHCNRLNILHGGTIASMVDLGGSLVLASRGLYSTGVSTDLNVTYLSSGGKVGDLIRAEASCDKCICPCRDRVTCTDWSSWEDAGVHDYPIHERQGRSGRKREPYQIRSSGAQEREEHHGPAAA